MKQELPNLSQLIKTKGQNKFQIKVVILTLVMLLVAVASFLQFQFFQPITLEGVIHSCFYASGNISCSYIQSNKGNFLLTEGTLDKVREGKLVQKLYNKKVKLTGLLSRQKVEVVNLGELRRFQIEKLEFLD